MGRVVGFRVLVKVRFCLLLVQRDDASGARHVESGIVSGLDTGAVCEIEESYVCYVC